MGNQQPPAEKRPLGIMNKYNTVVTADLKLEADRAAGCLCLRCIRLVTAEDCVGLCTDPDPAERAAHEARIAKSYNCPIAQRIYEACIDGDVAAPVTRCPMFVEK